MKQQVSAQQRKITLNAPSVILVLGQVPIRAMEIRTLQLKHFAASLNTSLRC